MSDQAPPPDPRRDRFAPLASAMSRLLVVVAIAAVGAVVLPDPWDLAAGWAMVVLLVVAPLVRVLWLVQRWFRRGDPRFASVGAAVLAVVLAGTLLALV